jgi:hypothetical protein
MLVPSREHRVKHRPDKLQCEILEGKRRPVKQFEQPQPLVELNQRRDRGPIETAVCR